MTKPIKKAGKTRLKRAALYARMSSHDTTLRDVLESTPACARNATIYDVVRHAHRVGPTGANKILKTAKVWPLKKVKELTEEERRKIYDALPPRAR